jgi:hypothetical protein
MHREEAARKHVALYLKAFNAWIPANRSQRSGLLRASPCRVFTKSGDPGVSLATAGCSETVRAQPPRLSACPPGSARSRFGNACALPAYSEHLAQ